MSKKKQKTINWKYSNHTCGDSSVTFCFFLLDVIAQLSSIINRVACAFYAKYSYLSNQIKDITIPNIQVYSSWIYESGRVSLLANKSCSIIWPWHLKVDFTSIGILCQQYQDSNLNTFLWVMSTLYCSDVQHRHYSSTINENDQNMASSSFYSFND